MAAIGWSNPAMLSRREFLKLSALLPLALGGVQHIPARQTAPPGTPNILIILFDTWSAENLSLYGYGRDTTPNLRHWAERAIVYHRHYSAGNYTIPSTASLLTGVYPWRHRAFRLYDRMLPAWASRNLFSAFPDVHRLAYAQNPIANVLVKQVKANLDHYLPVGAGIAHPDPIFTPLFSSDQVVASGARNTLFRGRHSPSGSLFLAPFYNRLRLALAARQRAAVREQYPIGMPGIDDENYLTIEDSLRLLVEETAGQTQPYLGYFHFFPPHDPYRPHQNFINRFRNDGFEVSRKPIHPLHHAEHTPQMLVDRRGYDSYIAQIDSELGRLMHTLQQRGDLQNTIVILTSDHGEMFERGFRGHFNRSLHQPVIHIPLMVFMPNQTERLDILSPTSTIDLLPTIAHWLGKPAPPWAEGQLLRPFQPGPPDPTRPVFTLEAKENHPSRPVSPYSAQVTRWPYKLTEYMNYSELYEDYNGELVELYNLETDPDELHDLAASEPALVTELRALLTRQRAGEPA